MLVTGLASGKNWMSPLSRKRASFSHWMKGLFKALEGFFLPGEACLKLLATLDHVSPEEGSEYSYESKALQFHTGSFNPE